MCDRMESSSTLASPSSAVESGVSHVRFEESSSVVEEPIPRIRDTLASPVSNHVEIPSMKLSSLGEFGSFYFMYLKLFSPGFFFRILFIFVE